jgi:hypothetical protein
MNMLNHDHRNPLGRDTEATIQSWDAIADAIQPAPTLFHGPLPRRSTDLIRFRNPRPRNQVRGTCVGQSGAAVAETTIRTPIEFDERMQPNPAVDLSPLWVYAIAREYSRAQGVRLGGEGAIVCHALLAVKERGFAPWDAWPCTETNERAFRDGRIPQSALDAPKLMPIQDLRRLTQPDQILEYLAGGYSVWIGVPWRGGMETRPDGSFGWGGRAAGGHAVELMGYDLDADRAWIGNSWAGWGLQPSGVGFTRWSALSRDLEESLLNSGSSEACVVTEVDGWQPKVKSWAEAF